MQYFYFEITDTFAGEANYCWVKRYAVNANKLHGALCKLSKELGLNFRFNGERYNVKNANICAFDITEQVNSTDMYYSFKFI